MFGWTVFLPPSAGSCLWKHPSILMAKVSRTIFQKFPSQTLAKLFSKHCNQSSTVKKDPCMLRGNSRVMQKLAPNQDQLMKMQKFSAPSALKEYLLWAVPPNPHIAAIYIANIYKVFSTKCDIRMSGWKSTYYGRHPGRGWGVDAPARVTITMGGPRISPPGLET